MSKVNTLELIQNTAPGKIAELIWLKRNSLRITTWPQIRKRRFNVPRQLVYFNQNIASSSQLQNADKSVCMLAS
jgi:hypothetical protein